MEASSSRPETHYVSLTDQYRQILRLWQHAVRTLDSESHLGGTVANKPGLREAKRFLVNSFSIFTTWGCDIRVETNSLDAIENTVIGVEIQTILDDLAGNIETSQVQRLLDARIHAQTTDLLLSLQAHVKSIRMQQASFSAAGPLIDLARQVTLLADDIMERKDSHSAASIDEPRDSSLAARFRPNAIPLKSPDYGARSQPPSASHASESTFQSSIFSEHISSTTGTSIEGTEETEGHWLYTLFRDLSVTSLDTRGERAKFHGESMPDAIAFLKRDQLDQILEITFGVESLAIYLYVRLSDHRARILCKTPNGSRDTWYDCKPFNKLQLRRSQSVITLYSRVTASNVFVPWLTLPFTSMERLTLFYCTCIALRSHDTHMTVSGIVDHELNGEMCLLAGEIRDDGYRHSLRIYRDRHSNSVRLHAAVITGQLKNTPVWTAFITDVFSRPNWARLEGRRTVLVRTLRRHVFAPRYSGPIHESGEHVLEFITSSDATDFLRTIEDLTKAY